MWKKIIPISLLILISVSGLSLSFWYNNPTIVELSSGSELLFFSGGNTTKNLQDEKKCKYVVNGSYFGKDGERFFPAGERFTVTGSLNYKKIENSDPNLGETLIFDEKQGRVQLFVANREVVMTGALVFNTWPRLIKWWKKNNDLAQSISHRNKAHPRTLVAQKWTKNLIVVFRNNLTLDEVADELLKLDIQNAVNLDGGPSTSISSSDPRVLNFNEQEKLPILFCIK